MSALSAMIMIAAAAAPAEANERERSFLIYVVEAPQLLTDRVSVSGKLCANNQAENCSKPARFEAVKSDGMLKVSMIVEGKPVVQHSVPLSLFPGLDIQSAIFHGRYEPGSAGVVVFKFAEKQDCFVNDDGRSKLTIVLEPGERRASVTTYEGCEIRSRDVVNGKLAD